MQQCPACQKPIIAEFSFCPHCGKELKEQPITIGKQISLYIFALLLPPLGLVPGIKYLRRSDPTAKKVGIALLLITLFSTILTIWVTIAFVNNFNERLTSQINQYQLTQ